MTTSEVESIDWPTTFIAIVPRVSGTLSVISSSIIIFVIFRSAVQLSTVYHRIMFAMSIFDIMGSIGLGLTSLPMPMEMPFEKELGISWPGVRYGNTFTCNLQAFSIGFGAFTMMTYNVSLCIYYACAIHFRLPEKLIRKYVQPIIMVVPIISGLAVSVPPWLLDLYNPPTSLASAWCTVIPYPDYENISNESLILRGRKSDQKKFNDWTSYALIFYFCVIVISLGLVMGTVSYLPKKSISTAAGSNSLQGSIICSDRDVTTENNIRIAVPSSASISLEGSFFKGEKLRNDSRHVPNEDTYHEEGPPTQSNAGVAKHTESPMINKLDPSKNESREKCHIANESKSVETGNAPFDRKVKKLWDGSHIVPKENVNREKKQCFIFYEGVDKSSKSSIVDIQFPQKIVDVNSRVPESDFEPSSIMGREHIDVNSVLGAYEGEISLSDSAIEDMRMIEMMRMNPWVLALHACGYIGSYGFLTALFCLIDPFDDGASTRLKIGSTIFPLQGLFNMLIFLSHKVYNYRRVHHDITIFQVLYLLFTTRVQEPFFVERMAVVHDHEAQRVFHGLYRFSNEMGDNLLMVRRPNTVNQREISEESSSVVSSNYNRNKNDDLDDKNGDIETNKPFYSSTKLQLFENDIKNFEASIGSGSSDCNLSGFSLFLNSGSGHNE